MSVTYFPEERCVMCGEVIEEGRQVCLRCAAKIARMPQQPNMGKGFRKHKPSPIARLLHKIRANG